jgi:hypothetical protein
MIIIPPPVVSSFGRGDAARLDQERRSKAKEKCKVLNYRWCLALTR